MELAEASVEEGDTIDLNVMRENGVDGTVTCRYSTIADTAAGHYTITTGELTFGPGQTEKTISVPTIENASLDGTRRFRMRIYNPGGGATIGSPNETEITIIDDDRVAELAVSPAHLRPTALAGTDAPPQTLAIINGGGAKLNYEVTASPSWIVANATSGVLGGASELLTISYKTRFRPPGRYRGTVTVTDLDGNLPTVEIPVTLTLGYPGESYTAEFNSDTDLPAGPGEAVASRYPLTFSLPPLDGRVSNSLLVFSALEHGQPADLDAALVPPGGGAGVLAMSDCLKNATDPMKFAIADGGAPLPSAGPADFAAYAPTNYGSGNDGFKFPGPEGPQLARMADLNGIASEGGWNLYLMDDNDLGGSGVLTGAALRIETVALDDGIVEIFDADHPFDLPRHSFLYTPSDTAGGYDIFHCQLSGLPAPVGGDKIEPAPDGYVPYALKNDEVIFFYGQKYGVVWIGEDGTIAFVDPAGAAGAPGLATHLALPRISGFFADLKLADGNIWAQQLGDRLVVTWNNVEDAATGEDVTFQIEIFFDDRIRITYAAIGKTAPLVGLSRGWGEAFAARQIDFSAIQNTGLMIRGHDLNPGAMSSLIWTSQPNLLYEIQWTDSFKTWKRVKTVPGGSGATTESSFLDSGGRAGFYRVFKTGTVE
ncbi:MAG: Calx-beta domain-containing protein [Verrucomicrobiales bacterium]